MSQKKHQPSHSVIKWTAGILATIISGVGVFWLTEGLRNSEPESVSVPTNQVEQSDKQQLETETTTVSPSQTEIEQDGILDGVWDVTVRGDRKVGSDGFIEETDDTIESSLET